MTATPTNRAGYDPRPQFNRPIVRRRSTRAS